MMANKKEIAVKYGPKRASEALENNIATVLDSNTLCKDDIGYFLLHWDSIREEERIERLTSEAARNWIQIDQVLVLDWVEGMNLGYSPSR